MNVVKLATFAVLGLASIAPTAQGRGVNGVEADGAGATGGHGSTPMSARASNIGPADTRASIAPALPVPPVGADASPYDYLRAARDALAAGRTGEAQQSLEMAETRELARSVAPDQANAPDPDPTVTRIRSALQVLGEGNRGRALEIVDAMAR